MFRVAGALKAGGHAAITWDRGRISGPGAVYVLAMAEVLEAAGERFGPHEGPTADHDYLRHPIPALFLLMHLFVDDAEFSDDIPERPPIPADAIG